MTTAALALTSRIPDLTNVEPDEAVVMEHDPETVPSCFMRLHGASVKHPPESVPFGFMRLHGTPEAMEHPPESVLSGSTRLHGAPEAMEHARESVPSGFTLLHDAPHPWNTLPISFRLVPYGCTAPQPPWNMLANRFHSVSRPRRTRPSRTLKSGVWGPSSTV